MKELVINNNIFDSIKHIDEIGNEYCEARELMIILGYNSGKIFIRL